MAKPFVYRLGVAQISFNPAYSGELAARLQEPAFPAENEKVGLFTVSDLAYYVRLEKRNPMSSRTFVYPSERRLKQLVGRVSAIAGFTELSVRRFLHESKEPSDPITHLKALSKSYGVSVLHLDFGLLKIRTNQLHIVSIDQVFEDFLRAFSKEHPAHDSWHARIDKETLLEYVLSEVTSLADFSETERLEYDLVEHYHEIRNRFAHSSKKKEPDVAKLQRRTKAMATLAKREAPQTYREIAYDDVIVFGWAVLGVVDAICARSCPKPSEIAQMVLALSAQPDSEVKLKDFRSREPKRRRQKLETLLSHLYSLEGELADAVIRELNMGC
jgi:hypothetical protein